jgi:hypothetical protein
MSGYTRIYIFTKLALNQDDGRMLHADTIKSAGKDIWQHSDILDSIDSIASEVLDCKSKENSLLKFSAIARSQFQKYKSMSSLYDIVRANYLDPKCPLVGFELSEQAILSNVQVNADFERTFMDEILTLSLEKESENYESRKSDRISNWLKSNKLRADFFEVQPIQCEV